MAIKRIICLFTGFLLTGGTFSLAQKPSANTPGTVIQNQIRVGYDDNIYQRESEDDAREGSAFIREIINISTELNFSSRTDMLLYWKPEFLFRFSADSEFVTYQDVYARLNHAFSRQMFVTFSDRYRYQQKEGQAGARGGGIRDIDQNYIENNFSGALDYILNEKDSVKFGGEYEFRVWDDEQYGEEGGNDYDQINGSISYSHRINPEKTQLLFGLNYSDHDYEGDRGGFEAVTGLIGVDQNFNPDVTGFARIGYTTVSIDTRLKNSDNSTPYLDTGIEINPSDRTSLSSTFGYSNHRSENSLYNSQNRFRFNVGARHDLTAKITLGTSLSYIHSIYDGSVSADKKEREEDIEDRFFTLGARCSYQIDRNNFVEAGYLFRQRAAGHKNLPDWEGNRIDFAWRLRL